ncbi:hypothetical protein HZA98_02325 [Candidatus Woesearchaeota archaeon]|nr:hypothetical protein [Candidatus Woesearchaeota archaeon]
MLEEVYSLLKEIKVHDDSYLVSCFFMNKEWGVDFYLPKEHKICTYFRKDGKLQSITDEIFQKKQKRLEKLDLSKVKISYLEALDRVTVDTDKAIVILQEVKGVLVWNITILTSEFKIYNLKVNAKNGKTISEEEENIMNFKKGGPEIKMTKDAS